LFALCCCPHRRSDDGMTARPSGFFPDLQALRRGSVLGLLLAGLLMSSQALALSEIPEEDVPVPAEDSVPNGGVQREKLPPVQTEPDQPSSQPTDEVEAPRPPRDMTVPLPDPIVTPRAPHAIAPTDEEANGEPTAEVSYDIELLPEPVARMRKLIIEAALTGEMEKLRPILEVGDEGTQLSCGVLQEGPIPL